MNTLNQTDRPAESAPAAQANTNGQRLFDIGDSVAYLHCIGATSATPSFIRSLIASGQVAHLKIGKKFYVTKTVLDRWLETREKRVR
jgi:hypothetical protein